jgi:hypothetical protein
MRSLITIIVALVVACHTGTACAPVTPPPPGPQPPLGYSCETFCKNAVNLGCHYAGWTGNGTPCEDVCLNITKTLHWDLACRSTKQTCYEIDQCERDR